jgi:hypothetical protein
MADNTNTMAGLLALNDRNLSGTEASDILNAAPVVRALFAQPASQGGTTHKFQRDATDPGVGFRLINEGITNATGTFDIVTLTLALLDGSFSRDKAVALAYKSGPTTYMDKEGTKSLRASFFALERALFASGQNKQFTSLAGNAFFDQITADAQVVNAGGNGGRSVWLLRSAEDGVSMICGNDGRLDMATEDATVVAHDSSARPYTALHRSIMGWFNVQVGSKYDAVRIANLDGTAGHTLTDALIATAIVKAKIGMAYSFIAMSRTSLAELQASRTATNPTGAPAPFPGESFGLPIIVTDGIPEDEAAINTTTTTTTTSTQA